MLPDTVLGHYRILSPLGKGGMGEVYAAEDTKLHRTVALKILPAAMASDPDLRKRFEREAQAVAAMNHPNIVTIHSVEEVAGVLFLTMEAVEGRTLKELIGKGGLPLDLLLRVSTATSDALAAAHQRGITHRDLKPANVMVTSDGRVKVLDFGLAKVRETERDAAAEQPTKLLSGDLTGEGRIIGTVAYMSPEQAEGKPVDQRSDIFSLGVMLHEMAAGERPFKGDTDISVISSILKDTPSAITDIKPDLPAGLARIVRRCLAKDPGRRYQTATDLRNDLEELKQDLDSGISQATAASLTATRTAQAGATRGGVPATWIGVGLVALLAAAAGLYAWMGRRPATPGFATFAAERFTRLTESGTADMAALSSDGRYVVHVKNEDGLNALWVRQTATTSDVRVVAPSEVRYDAVAFSPDGNYIYYVTYPRDQGIASLYRVPTLGGTALRVVEDIDSGPAFSPDGQEMAFIRGIVQSGLKHLMVAGIDGSGARPLATPDGAMRFQNETPAWSPDGRTILVPASEGTLRYGILAVDAATGATRQLGGDWLFTRNVRWMPDGRSFVMDGVDRVSTTQTQIWQVTYPGAELHRITTDLNGYRGVSLSGDGRLLATVQATTESSLWIVSREGVAQQVPLRPGIRSPGTSGIEWMPDGRLLFTAEVGDIPQIWVAGADGADARQLTSGEHLAAFTPVPSPDGRWIYYVGAGETVRIYRMGADGADQRPLTGEADAVDPLVSPDGRWVYYTATVEGRPRLMKMTADGREAAPVIDGLFSLRDISADGTLFLGTAWNAERGRTECAVLPASGGTPRLLGDIGASGGAIPATCRWAVDGVSVAYGAFREGRTNIFVRPLDGGPERPLTRFERDALPQTFGGAWAPDGRLVLSRGRRNSDVVLVTARGESN